jgi:type VI secretion system protein VasG
MEGSVNLSTVAIAIACLALLVAIVALHQARERTGSPPVREPYTTINREYKSTLKLFVSQLDEPARRALESAAGLAKAHTHYYLDLEHWLVKVFQTPGPELQKVLQENQILAETIKDELSRALSTFPTGNSSAPQLSTGVVNLLFASCVVEKEQFVGPCDLLLALLVNTELSARIGKTVPSLVKLPVESLRALENHPKKESMHPESEKESHGELRSE